MHNTLMTLRKYSDVSGHASTREFWWFFALSAVVFVTTVVIEHVVMSKQIE